MHRERWVHGAEVAIRNILRHGQQAWPWEGGTVFEARSGLLQNKTIAVVIHAGAITRPGIVEPLSRTRIGNKIVDQPTHGGRTHTDGNPERLVRSGGGAEDFAALVPDLPIAAVLADDDRRGEVHGDVHGLTGCHGCWERHEVLPAHLCPVDEHDAVICRPRAGTGVPQPPDLGKV